MKKTSLAKYPSLSNGTALLDMGTFPPAPRSLSDRAIKRRRAMSQPTRHPSVNEPAPASSPGDEVPPGTPGAGENICKRCGGSGKVQGKDCPEREGTGKVTTGVGGA